MSSLINVHLLFIRHGWTQIPLMSYKEVQERSLTPLIMTNVYDTINNQSIITAYFCGISRNRKTSLIMNLNILKVTKLYKNTCLQSLLTSSQNVVGSDRAIIF